MKKQILTMMSLGVSLFTFSAQALPVADGVECRLTSEVGVSRFIGKSVYSCDSVYGAVSCGYSFLANGDITYSGDVLFPQTPSTPTPRFIVGASEGNLNIAIVESIELRRYIWGDYYGNDRHLELQEDLFAARAVVKIPFSTIFAGGYRQNVLVPLLKSDSIIQGQAVLDCNEIRP